MQDPLYIREFLPTGKNKLDFFTWGLVPFWAKDPKIGNRMINARSETLAEKSSFKGPFKRQRCVIFADGFFEWKKSGKTKPLGLIGKKKRTPLIVAAVAVILLAGAVAFWAIMGSRDGSAAEELLYGVFELPSGLALSKSPLDIHRSYIPLIQS